MAERNAPPDRRVIEHLMANGLIEANRAYGEAYPGPYEVVFTLER